MAHLLEYLFHNWIYAASAVLTCYLLTQYFNRSLYSIPGPFFAKFTNLWRLRAASNGDYHAKTISLHKKYGDFVRLGPNIVSIADPLAVKEIYGFGAKSLPKGAFYDVFALDDNGRPLPPSLFGVRDEKLHAVLRRPIAGAYSMTSLVEYEPAVDTVILEFIRQLETRYAAGGADSVECDIAAWFQYYAFDVIGQITWSQTMGFLETGSDVQRAIQEIADFQTYGAIVGQMPFLHRILKKNAIARRFDKSSNFFPRMAFGIIQKRQAETTGQRHGDFLAKFLAAAKQSPEIVDLPMLISYTMNNVIAGSDTTSITLRAILYYVLKTPNVKRTLLAELDAANLSTPVSWANSQTLPYLDAVIKEALRLHPAVGFGLERVVSKEGLLLSNGKVLPGGTEVSMNAWVIHRDTRLFGADADHFNPLRWLRNASLETPEAYQARISAMKRVDLTFGGGSRTCIGKNVSLLEIYKAIPTLFLKFDVVLVHPEREWVVTNAWFAVQSHMNVYLKVRRAGGGMSVVG